MDPKAGPGGAFVVKSSGTLKSPKPRSTPSGRGRVRRAILCPPRLLIPLPLVGLCDRSMLKDKGSLNGPGGGGVSEGLGAGRLAEDDQDWRFGGIALMGSSTETVPSMGLSL